jgi:Tol biopolymer transport system component
MSLTYAARCVALAIAGVLCAPVATASPQGSTFTIVFATDRAIKTYATDLWLVDSNGENERPLTQAPTPETSPSWSPDGRTIVYACAPGSNWEVCTIDPATKQVTQLTKTAADEFDPRYTPDGKRIVVETYLKGRGNADLALMPATGGVPRRLTSTLRVDEQDPKPDPNSTRLAFASDGNIAILDINAPKRVKFVTRRSSSDTDPSFSSDDRIAFARREGDSYNIVVADRPDPADGGRTESKLTQGGQIDLEPAWTADAHEIFFARAQRPRSRRYRIFRMDADGGGERAITKGGAYADFAPAPQPVGSPRLPGRTSRDIAAPATSSHLLSVRAAASCKGHRITGSQRNDNLRGTRVGDCIYGLAGNDEISMIGGGTDYANGGTGSNHCRQDASDTSINCPH